MNSPSIPVLTIVQWAARAMLPLLLAVASASASTETISKTFEFGPGTSQPRSHLRSFTVPSGQPVKVVVTFKRLGSSDSRNDLPITIEAHSPGSSAGAEGPIRAQKDVLALATNTTVVVYDGVGDADGCDRPWMVRVRTSQLKSDPAFAVTGTIQVIHGSTDRAITFDPNNATLNLNVAKGTTVSKKLNVPGGSGTIRIRAEWHTDPLDLANFNSYHKLTIRLLRGTTVIASQTAFSRHAPSDKTPKLDFTEYVSPYDIGGDYKLEVVNGSAVNIVDFHINENGAFTSEHRPGCQ